MDRARFSEIPSIRLPATSHGSVSRDMGRGVNRVSRLQRLELILESHNGSFTTLDTISMDSPTPKSKPFAQPAPGFSIRQPKRGYGDAWISRPLKLRRLPATSHSCV